MVSTDIGGTDPDDFQSMVHLLLYADVLDIEGLISSPFGPGRKKDILEVIDRYEQDYANLKSHSGAYPTPDALRAITKQGATERAGYHGFGEPTEGSEWIVARARVDDPRPLHVLVWGLLEDLAQALYDAPDIAPKLRVYWIGGPNKKWSPDAYQYIADHHPDLWMIEANATYRGWFVGGRQAGAWSNEGFVDEHVAGHGALGAFFATQLGGRIKMGDSPSVGRLLEGTPGDPAQPGWGGRFVRAWDRPYDRYDRMTTPADRMQAFGILELALPLGAEAPDRPEAWLEVDNQSLVGYLPGDGTVRFRFSPKDAGTYAFSIRSNVPTLKGLIGGITAFTPPPDLASRPSTKYPNWWTDDPAPEFAEEGHIGARTVNRWREDFLSDFAARMRRAAEPYARDRTLAFPGAEGYGKYTRGGRGGTVYEVTNLRDAGPGSLRAAIEASGPRTVVFRVSGTIALESPLRIENPYLTIAGQTAPGDGIAIKDHQISIGADEVIIRYVRVRLGDQTESDADAVSSRYVKNVILDHISASWSIDETLSVYHADSVTVQWSLVSESLFDTHHEKGTHGFGGIWGGNHSTYHHNLLAHHSSRNPRFASGCGYTDVRNNVVFNWGYNSTYGGEKAQVGNPRFDFCVINLVANYYKPGPATRPGEVMHRIASPSSREGAADYGRWYVAGNVVHGNDWVTADNWSGGVQPGDGPSALPMLRLEAPFPSMPIDLQSAEEAFRSVLDNVGATLPRRDAVDARIIDEARGGHATFEGAGYTDRPVAGPDVPSGIIDSQADVGGWPELKSTTPPADTDHDGMPDDWEIERGLNPNDGADGKREAADGYTMLEKYLNGIEFEVPVSEVRTARLSDTAIEVRWADVYLAEEGFVVERSVDGGPYAPLIEVGRDVSSVTDDSVNGAGRFAYRVRVKPSRSVR